MKSKTKSGKYARLREPLIRDGGRLRPAAWDEALDFAAKGLRSTVDCYGPRSFGLFSCSKSTNELNYVSQKFARVVLGSHNIDSCNRT
jgi:formate dehydrogenase major subunit